MMRWIEEILAEQQRINKSKNLFDEIRKGTYICREPTDGEPVPVFVNIYDLMPKLNRILKPCRMGVFHAGVEVYGTEVSYHGTNEKDNTGVYESVPTKAGEQMIFRKSIFIGYTKMSKKEVNQMVKQLKHQYKAEGYHLLRRNCCSFTKVLTKKLCGKNIPKWINRLARVAKRSKIVEAVFDDEDFMP